MEELIKSKIEQLDAENRDLEIKISANKKCKEMLCEILNDAHNGTPKELEETPKEADEYTF